MESDSSSAQVHWDQSTSYSGMSDCSNDSDDNSNSADWMAGGKRTRKCDSSGESSQMMSDSRPARRLPGPRPSCRDEEVCTVNLWINSDLGIYKEVIECISGNDQLNE